MTTPRLLSRPLNLLMAMVLLSDLTLLLFLMVEHSTLSTLLTTTMDMLLMYLTREFPSTLRLRPMHLLLMPLHLTMLKYMM